MVQACPEDLVGRETTVERGIRLPVAHRMSQEELYRVLVQFNDTRVDYPEHVCLHQLFEAQVLRMPDRVAVVYEGTRLTYAELNLRANQLAHHLRALGVGPEVSVGVYMERSLEMVVALYAILKAGGAYVPLDPEYPRERIAFMLEDAQAPVLLTQKHLLLELPAHGPEVVCLDTDWPEIEGMATHNPSSGVTAENLAYVIFTSGTTGRPKGVMNCHRGICNRLLWMQDAYQLTEEDCIVQKTPFSFDVSVWEFFWPLLFGARLVVARPGGHKDSSYLVNLIVEHRVTTIHFVPSMLQLFLDDRAVGSCQSLKRVICSGEALPHDLQERFFTRLDAELHNLYGPTEAAVDVTYWACEQGSSLDFVPIGRPVANTQIYILDDKMEPVPVGESGELHIGGVQVARGYINRPELTEERFIPDPFSDQLGARLYRTGDLASYLPTGAIKFLGRIDHQVKIRGNRIELGEIESVLGGHPAVKQAVVLAREDEPGEKRLVAYVVANPGQIPDTGQLRLHLLEKLPDYMIPSAFVVLDEMPLSPNGKVDRRALPKPSNKRPELGQAYVAPRNELERYLASIWCDIIQLDRVGIHDRFFELGGTSLQAARFINRLQQELNENIYIVSVFEAPTIAEYAAFLQKDYAGALSSRLGLGQVPEQRPQPDWPVGPGDGRIDEQAIARMMECIVSLPTTEKDEKEPKNPPAIFVLAPPRSGTTLLRVMLAGHPDLFAASELQLLGFNTLRERRTAYSGKFSLWLEGTIRTIMEIRGCDAEEATRIMEEYERRDYTTKQLYAVLQEWIGARTLVDKSPSYVLDLSTLEKAERDFQDALYIHLVRHPYAMVRSFESYHMDQVLFLKAQPFSPRQLGELVWLISHRNVLQFLRNVPEHRQYHMRFEDLVSQPQVVVQEMCQTLQLNFHAGLMKPYENVEKKMTNGIYEESKPMGDTRFLEHRRINPEVAKAWQGVLTDDFLSDLTWDLALLLGYERSEAEALRPDSPYHLEQQPAGRSRRELLEQHRQRRMQLRKER
jgi:amino acid adenylation domain-containing protein